MSTSVTTTTKRSCSVPPVPPKAPVLSQHHPHRFPPQPLGQGNGQDILLMDRVEHMLEFSDKGVVKSGCTDALIVYASLPSSSEHHRIFVDAFLNTYCTFLNPDQLVDKLIYRFEKLSSSQLSTRRQFTEEEGEKLACSTLCLLVHVVSSLSSSDALLRWPNLRSRLAEFVYSLLRRPGLWHLAVTLRRELLKAESNLQNNYNNSLNKPNNDEHLLLSPVSSTQVEPAKGKPTSFLDFKSRRIAEQMTLIDWKMFEQLDLAELLVYATSSGSSSSSSCSSTGKDDLSSRTPRLSQFTRHFNDVSLWARTLVLKQESDKLRERHMLKLTKVVQHLRHLQNFNSSLALLSALDSAAIRRLASSARVTKRIKATVHSLRDLTDSSQSFRAYRTLLENCHPPAIPYLGLTLQVILASF